MDIELVRTFLEVNRLRHFARAAERLYVTPAAVSARVRLLEDHVGARLFTRNRNNIRLTAAGQRFLPHAENMVRSWNRAMLSVGSPGEQLELVALGSLHSIWDVLLGGWLPQVYGQHSELVLQIDLLTSQAVVARVREQSLDLGLLYEPPRASDLWVEPVAAVQLVLVSDRTGLGVGDELPDYVHVDWGLQYAMALSKALPELPDPALRVDSPEVAYEFLRSRGGTAYLPRLTVAPDLECRRLHLVGGAPVIERPVFLIESAESKASGAHAAVRDSLVAWFGSARDAA
ncbi:MAG: LysR family transcriptional regulator [Pseudomonadales bacterium]